MVYWVKYYIKPQLGMNHSISSFTGKRVLLIGDIMLDRYVYGKVDRISPEAPVPIHLYESESSDIGGAGTVLRNLSDLGAEIIFISVIGDDKHGDAITDLVGNIKNTEAYLITEYKRPTTVKTRFVCGHHQMARADNETSKVISNKTLNAVKASIDANIAKCDIVVISDYAKGVISSIKAPAHDLAAYVIQSAAKHGISVVVDPKSNNFSIYRGAYVITPNIPELNRATNTECSNFDDIEIAARSLISSCGIDNILVTRSKDGMTLFGNSSPHHNIPSFAREVYDVTGAGDTAVAVLALGLASGMLITEASYLANVAAGIAVGKIGTATVSVKELECAL